MYGIMLVSALVVPSGLITMYIIIMGSGTAETIPNFIDLHLSISLLFVLQGLYLHLFTVVS
jgi:hypothetical protein